MTTLELDKAFLAKTYDRFPLEIVKGQGSLVYDAEGKSYIDLGTGIAVNTFGLADSQWIQAVTEQLGKFQHTSNLYYSAPGAQLAQLLCQRTGMKRVFFSNSGAEANECAIKAARKYGAQKKGPECYTILTLENSFHGRTLTTLAATGQEVFHKDFQPLTPGFVSIAPTVEALKKAAGTYSLAGILFESIQGEGGVLPLEPAFVKAMAELCQKEDILLMADEVQTGNGRTGKLYGYMHYGVTPDVVSTAKGLGGGLPLGATMLGEKVQDIFTPGSHGSTFGGNPVCCAGALSILQRLNDTVLQGVTERSNYIVEELSGAKGVKAVTGMGLMLGIATQKPASQVVSTCMEHGVLVLKAKDKVRLLPALNIPMAMLEQAVGVLKEACAERL